MKPLKEQRHTEYSTFSELNACEASEPVRMAPTRRLLEVPIEALQLQQRWREGGAMAGDLEFSESINETDVIKWGINTVL